MRKTDWNKWLQHDGDKVLTWLHGSEEEIKTAIFGIGLFIMKRIPAQLRILSTWSIEKCLYACRVATRIARICGLGIAWFVIMGGPLAVCPNVFTGGWAGLALAGSWWALQRKHGWNQNIIVTEVKAVRRS